MRVCFLIAQVFAAIAVACTLPAHAGEQNIHRVLLDALICKGNPADAVYNLVRGGSNFEAGYATHGFGEGTSYKAVVILRKPLNIAGAKAFAVVSETENSNFEFNAFTYASFEGDYLQVVQALKLKATEPFNNSSLGRFVSQQPPLSQCPPTVTLTPVDKKHFLLGCGWCNGG